MSTQIERVQNTLREFKIASLRRQLINEEKNLLLIQERKSEFPLEINIPLYLIEQERRKKEHIEKLKLRIKELEQSQPHVEEGIPKAPKVYSIGVGILLSIVVIVGGLLILLPLVPPKVEVALLTYHGRYVTDVNDKNDLKAKTWELEDLEKFTLLCLDDGKVAFETYHGWYVTALNDEGDSFVKFL